MENNSNSKIFRNKSNMGSLTSGIHFNLSLNLLLSLMIDSPTSSKQYTTFKVTMQKHIIYDTSFWEVCYAKHCFVCHWEHKYAKLIA